MFSTPHPSPTILWTAAIIILSCLLPLQANALITTNAKCLPGYDWMFTSASQSPCDVAAELASVCIARPFNLDPLPVGYVYSSPTTANQNDCRCSSVYYSLLSGCAYCQDRSYRLWSTYVTNCSMVYLTTYNQEIPIGVKVPAWAYQNVSVYNQFNVTIAYGLGGVESSRPAGISSTRVPTPTSTSILSSASRGSSGSNGASANTTIVISPSNTTIVINNPSNAPAIAGGVVGGLVGLGLIAAIITFLVLRSKKKPQSQNQTSNLPQSPLNMLFTPGTTASLIHSTASPPPSTPGVIYNPNDPSTYPSPDLDVYDPYRQHSPPIYQNATPTFTGSSVHNYLPPQNTGGRSHYSGMPEL